ncbi:MAG: winged helix-turn-helix transcriptional regulator [Patescibacteria group bacterium]
MRKTNRELERIVKGFANHRRLQILELLYKEPELSVGEVAQKIKSDVKNVSAHITKMAIAGLVMKRHDINLVRHKLTKRGRAILQFVRIIE